MSRAVRLGPLAEREFRLLFTGEVVSLLGTAVAPVALAFAVLDDLDGSASQLGLVLAATWLPQIAFVLAGGVLADRLPRHLVLVGANLLSGAAQAGSAFVLLTGRAELWHLVAFQVARGIATSFFFPAAAGVVPQTVAPSLLRQANALLRMASNTSFIAGSAVGGIAVATVGAGWALAFDAATYFASALVLSRMRTRVGTGAGERNFVRELLEGWSEFRGRTWLWLIVVVAAFENMVWVGCFSVLGPLVADRALGGATAWGTILAVQSAGLLVGGVLALRLKPERPLLVGQAAILLLALPLAALAAELPTAAIALAAAVSAVGLELFGVYWQTALQQHVPEHVLSRVNSYDALGSFLFIPVGLTLAGPVSDLLGVSTVLWGAAIVFALGQSVPLASRDVRNLRWAENQSSCDVEDPIAVL